MSKLITIGGHTIDESILSDGVIIDVGCRGFEFSRHFKNNKVFCIDPDEEVFKDQDIQDNFTLLNLAISDKRGDTYFYRNGESSILCDLYKPLPHLYTPCKTITMEDLYEITGKNVDILKLDCEAGEYAILGDGFQPIPKQITVEFHKHYLPELHEKCYEKCLANILEHYVSVKHDFTEQYGAGYNYWDCLFTRKDLC